MSDKKIDLQIEENNAKNQHTTTSTLKSAALLACVPIPLAIILYFCMNGNPSEWWQFLRTSILATFTIAYIAIMDIYLRKLPFITPDFMDYRGYAGMIHFFFSMPLGLIIGYIVHLILSSCCNIQITDWLSIR